MVVDGGAAALGSLRLLLPPPPPQLGREAPLGARRAPPKRSGCPGDPLPPAPPVLSPPGPSMLAPPGRASPSLRLPRPPFRGAGPAGRHGLTPVRAGGLRAPAGAFDSRRRTEGGCWIFRVRKIRAGADVWASGRGLRGLGSPRARPPVGIIANNNKNNNKQRG